MALSLRPYNSTSSDAEFIGWVPVPLTIENSPDGRGGVLILSSRSLFTSSAKAEFFMTPTAQPEVEIQIALDPGQTVQVFIAGMFQPEKPHNGASPDSKDVRITAHWQDALDVPAESIDLMIRVRRNANELTDKARNDFLDALAILNGISVNGNQALGPGLGPYVTDFVAAHVEGASLSQHRDSHFLPWHRLYLLDLERQLQAINPLVSLHYWRFDEPAPNLFSSRFFGETRQIPRDIAEDGGAFDPGGSATPLAVFHPDNPLSRWQIGVMVGIPRTARFDTQTEAANGLDDSDNPNGNFPVLNEAETLKLGFGGANPSQAHLGSPGSGGGFVDMEGTPHGAAHVSFNGPINSVPVAPRDPLFFLLHANVDRLWGVWQFAYDRMQPNDRLSYPFQVDGDAEPWKIISAPQWPWADILSQPGRLLPPGSRRNNFPSVTAGLNFDSSVPTLAQAIDILADSGRSDYIGTGYDDVPFISQETGSV